MSYLLHVGSAPEPALFGGKGRALARLGCAGFPVPPWFAVSPQAFEASLSEAQRQVLAQARDAEAVAAVLETLMPAPAICAELTQSLARLCPNNERVAVRSSALDEDGAQHSFAGQLDSYLFVSPAEVARRVADVWRSGFSERVLAYRQEHKLGRPRAPAVLVQRMIDAEVSGVAFAADPVSGRRGIAVVGALYGLGTALVSGAADADTYQVDRATRIVKREIADKRIRHRMDPGAHEGVRSERVPVAQAQAAALNDAQILAVAALARRASRHHGWPQDIEWAIEGGQLYLLQSRPITSLAMLADPDATLDLWDNSNIAESYSGVTTPLTFSFARRAYEEVYRQFCYLMGVPQTTIDATDVTFRRMLGLVRGRVYYNLLSWYRVLATLPGFTVNRRFMEQMMGVKEGLPAELLAELGAATRAQKIKDGLRLARTFAGLVANHVRLNKGIRRFYERLNRALAPTTPALDDMRPDELIAHYLDLERRLLTRWDAPLVNDFFAMIFYGVLRKQAQSWCGDSEGSLQNDLLCGEGGMISAEPAQRVRAMAQLAARDPAFTVTLTNDPIDLVLQRMSGFPEFQAQYDEYLAKFGDRCLEELKLESATLHDDPTTLVRSIGQFALRVAKDPQGLPSSMEAEIRAKAEQNVTAALRGRWLRGHMFRWVLGHTRERVRERENLRFERTRLFGRVRRIFVELGKRLHTIGVLDHPRDIFYLEVYEAIGFVDGTTSTADLRGLVALRKREFEGYREGEAPADRFETRGIVHQGNSFRDPKPVAAFDGEQLQGIGCCPGVVHGRVRLIIDPRNAVLNHGEILVAERTDPGWIMLFPAAAGVLVEHGSLLSHSAIVAREMGIPAVVALAGVTRWLGDGDWVELDGASGVVRRLVAHPTCNELREN